MYFTNNDRAKQNQTASSYNKNKQLKLAERRDQLLSSVLLLTITHPWSSAERDSDAMKPKTDVGMRMSKAKLNVLQPYTIQGNERN